MPKSRWLIFGGSISYLLMLGAPVGLFRAEVAPIAATTAELVYTLKGHTGTVQSLAFSPDGQILVSGGGSRDGTLRLWNLGKNGDNFRTFKAHQNRVLTVAFAEDNQTVISGSDDGMLNIWSRYEDDPRRIFLNPATNVMALAIHPQLPRLFSGGLDGVKIWDLRTRRPLQHLLHYETIYSVAVSSNGKFLACGDKDGNIRVWDLETGAEWRTIPGHIGAVNVMIFTPAGEKLITGSADGLIKIWDMNKGELIVTLEGHLSPINALAIHPEGETLASAGRDGIKMWNINTGKQLEKFFGHSDWVQSLAFSPDGKLLATGGFDKLIKIWEIKQTLDSYKFSSVIVRFSGRL